MYVYVETIYFMLHLLRGMSAIFVVLVRSDGMAVFRSRLPAVVGFVDAAANHGAGIGSQQLAQEPVLLGLIFWGVRNHGPEVAGDEGVASLGAVPGVLKVAVGDGGLNALLADSEGGLLLRVALLLGEDDGGQSKGETADEELHGDCSSSLRN